jgi:DNA-binding response OmpR family regulator
MAGLWRQGIILPPHVRYNFDTIIGYNAGMRAKETILIIDDEPKILEAVKSYFGMNGYDVLCSENGREGLTLFEQNPVSLILLDLMLPGICGEDFCKRVRRESDIPIIMLTAKTDEASIVNGLNIGADDYVTKPFSLKQLLARARAVIRRNGGVKTGTCLSYKNLTVDTEKKTASLDGEILPLTRDEFNILALLMSRQTKIFTRDEILETVKGDDFDGFDRAVDSHIKRLRAKIEDDPKTPAYIETVYGMGYRMADA